MATQDENGETDPQPLSDPIEEGRRVVETANGRGLTVRSIGGTAIWEHAETMHEEPFARDYRDVDFVTTREDKDAVIEFMGEMGYDQNERFNTMHRFQLEFQDPVNGRKADYIVDKFRFCHSWSLRERIETDYPTVPIEDLLLSKLQIAEISDRDIRDIIAMFTDHPVGTDGDTETIDADYVAGLCQGDWGLYKTTTMNLDRVESYLAEEDLPVDQSALTDRVDALREAIETEPKTIRWKLRSLVGERKQWYRRPEVS
jgi:hypothetical protein